MKKSTAREKIKNICMCIRGDKFWSPLAAAQNYSAGAKVALKKAKPLKHKRLIKDIKRDIKLTKIIIAELRHTSDIDRIEKRVLGRYE